MLLLLSYFNVNAIYNNISHCNSAIFSFNNSPFIANISTFSTQLFPYFVSCYLHIFLRAILKSLSIQSRPKYFDNNYRCRIVNSTIIPILHIYIHIPIEDCNDYGRSVCTNDICSPLVTYADLHVGRCQSSSFQTNTYFAFNIFPICVHTPNGAMLSRIVRHESRRARGFISGGTALKVKHAKMEKFRSQNSS